MPAYDEMDRQSYRVSLRRVAAYLIDSAVWMGILWALWTAIGGSLLSFAEITRTTNGEAQMADGSVVLLSRSEVQRALACPGRGEFTRIEVMVVPQQDGPAVSPVGVVAEGCGEPAELRARLKNVGEEDHYDWPITTDEQLSALLDAIVETSYTLDTTDPETAPHSSSAPGRSVLASAIAHIDLVRAETGTTAKRPYAAPILVINLAVYVLYFLLLEHFTIAGSIGKRMLGVAVVTGDAVRLEFAASAIRTLIKCFVLPISIITVPFNRRRRALHDMAAGTYVVRASNLHPCEATNPDL